ncbi:hypothetical protein HZA96_02270 [Candidatus Woesearchaeota archaeon]|nr:hypothetical protein [Candidatus Woesearchaeota archaeon]
MNEKRKASKKRNKKAQTWSLEVFMAMMIFLIATVMFYAVIFTAPKHKELTKEAELITKSIDTNELFEDGMLTQEEAEKLSGKTCNELKQMVNTNKKICIYFKDQSGNIVPLSAEYNVIGCDGITVGSIECTAPKQSNACDDGVQNGDEEGIDCGEICGNECAQAPATPEDTPIPCEEDYECPSGMICDTVSTWICVAA